MKYGGNCSIDGYYYVYFEASVETLRLVRKENFTIISNNDAIVEENRKVLESSKQREC